jgi:hypothetical protein
MLTSRQIDDHISTIVTTIGELARGNGDLARFAETHDRFEALREHYRLHPETLTARVQELAALRKRFVALLAPRLSEIVDRFHALNQEIKAAEQERECWRDALVRLALDAGGPQLTGRGAVVRVRAVQFRSVPAARSEERQQLETLIRTTGLWEQVSQLSRPKLEKSLKERLFDAQTTQAIDRLCPATVSYQVTSRQLGSSGD